MGENTAVKCQLSGLLLNFKIQSMRNQRVDALIPPTLVALFNVIGELSPEAKQDIGKILQHQTFSKKDFILTQGQICRHIYFIEYGLARSFYLDDGKEITSWFMMENDVIISVKSFFVQVPAAEYIQALEDTSLYYISFHDLMALYEAHPSFNTIGRRLIEIYYMKSEDRLQNIRKKDAFERYNFLITQHPEIRQRVSSRIISSYLGISEETISRLRERN